MFDDPFDCTLRVTQMLLGSVNSYTFALETIPDMNEPWSMMLENVLKYLSIGRHEHRVNPLFPREISLVSP